MQIIEEEGLSLSQVYNCDETGLYWKALPTKTLASQREEKAPGYKVSKERVTILACANATGDHKLPLTMKSTKVQTLGAYCTYANTRAWKLATPGASRCSCTRGVVSSRSKTG